MPHAPRPASFKWRRNSTCRLPCTRGHRPWSSPGPGFRTPSLLPQVEAGELTRTAAGLCLRAHCMATPRRRPVRTHLRGMAAGGPHGGRLVQNRLARGPPSHSAPCPGARVPHRDPARATLPPSGLEMHRHCVQLRGPQRREHPGDPPMADSLGRGGPGAGPAQVPRDKAGLCPPRTSLIPPPPVLRPGPPAPRHPPPYRLQGPTAPPKWASHHLRMPRPAAEPAPSRGCLIGKGASRPPRSPCTWSSLVSRKPHAAQRRAGDASKKHGAWFCQLWLY